VAHNHLFSGLGDNFMAAAKIAKKIGKIDKTLLNDMVSAFAQTALPGENEGFDAKAAEDAARFTIETGLHRKPGTAALALDSFTDTQGRLRMRKLGYRPMRSGSVCSKRWSTVHA
jgi:hypothetical protein